jgi:hypothetical protein
MAWGRQIFGRDTGHAFSVCRAITTISRKLGIVDIIAGIGKQTGNCPGKRRVAMLNDCVAHALKIMRGDAAAARPCKQDPVVGNFHIRMRLVIDDAPCNVDQGRITFRIIGCDWIAGLQHNARSGFLGLNNGGILWRYENVKLEPRINIARPNLGSTCARIETNVHQPGHERIRVNRFLCYIFMFRSSAVSFASSATSAAPARLPARCDTHAPYELELVFGQLTG